MNFVDIGIILLCITALVRGAELGLARQVFSTAGLFGGLFLGVYLSGLVHVAHTPSTKALVVLAIVVACVGVMSSIGEYIGLYLKDRLEQTKVRIFNAIDRTVGSGVAMATLLLIVWLGAALCNNLPFAGLQRQIRNSTIIATMNNALPPAPSLVARLGHLINPNDFPNVFTGLEPAINTNKPLPSIGDLDSAVAKVRASVVKVAGEGCGGITEGSGFVAANGEVITNAHVVAGVAHPAIIDGAGEHAAQVIAFDPDLDMAVLRANGLAGPALTMDATLAESDTSVVIAGYPGGGDFSAKPGVILDSFNATGRNIYNQDTTTRQIYSVKGQIIPGNSGGPLVNADGIVVGLVFAKSTAYDNVGYALTMQKVVSEFSQVKSNVATVGTGSCAE